MINWHTSLQCMGHQQAPPGIFATQQNKGLRMGWRVFEKHALRGVWLPFLHNTISDAWSVRRRSAYGRPAKSFRSQVMCMWHGVG